MALGAGTLRATAVVRHKSSIHPVPVPLRVWTRYSSWAFHEEARMWEIAGFREATADGGLSPAYSDVTIATADIVKFGSRIRTTKTDHVVRAYRDLDLHPVIEKAGSKLYLDGHYASAIEATIKALCSQVRLRSGKELDGADLMKTVFSPKNPILRFNDFKDRSDHDEQEGFMMMFAGAGAGLRNPRAHKIIKDYPERALEYIAYISLLAKLLDGARKV